MTHALIIGGGVAGAATSMALHKAGIGATLYEAHSTGAGDRGAFLMVMRNGLDALQAIDAHAAVADASFPARTVDYRASTGKRMATHTIGGDATDHNRPRTLTRPALYRALHAELGRRGGTIHHGKRLTHAARTPQGGVIVTFDDGTRAEGDLLIGADGIHSVTRSHIDPYAPRASDTGQVLVFGSTQDTSLPASPQAYRMIYGKRGFFGYTTSPGGETLWFAQLADATETVDLTGAQLRHRTREVYADDHTPAARIVDATMNPLASSIYDIESVPTWHDTATVLVGDAAHAASPAAAQGASLALEDSVLLAKCLRDLPTSREAFRAYTRLRRPRVERLATFSANQAQDQTPRLRRRLLPRRRKPAPFAADPDSRAWLYHHHIDWHQPIEPPVDGRDGQDS